MKLKLFAVDFSESEVELSLFGWKREYQKIYELETNNLFPTRFPQIKNLFSWAVEQVNDRF